MLINKSQALVEIGSGLHPCEPGHDMQLDLAAAQLAIGLAQREPEEVFGSGDQGVTSPTLLLADRIAAHEGNVVTFDNILSAEEIKFLEAARTVVGLVFRAARDATRDSILGPPRYTGRRV